MAVSVNATGTKLYTGSAGTSINYTGLTVAAGSNTAIVGLLFVDSATNISGVTATWDSGGTPQAMTQLIEKDNAGGGGANAVYIFGLAGEHGAVATGNKTLNVSWTGSQRTFFVAMAFDGVDQAGGAVSFRNPTAGAGGAGTVSTIPVISATGNKVVALESAGISQGTSTGTLVFEDHTSGAVINAMCQYDNGASSVTIGNSGGNASIAAIDILAASSFIAGGGARFKQRWNRSPLAYPAGAVPGMDASHPAAQNLLLSAIPGGSDYVNLVTGASLTAINGSVAPTNGIDASIGPSNYNPLASAAFDYGVNLSQTVTQLTFAAILRPVSLASSYQGVLTFNSSTGGLYLNSGVVDYYFGGDHGNISLTVGTPYFIAASAGSITNIVVKNLSTGQVYTFTNVGTFGSTSLSNIAISLASNQSGSYISSAMSSATNLSMQQLLQWAKSPWEFWYPNKTINLASAAASAGASFLPVWAYQYNLPVLGTGNF